MVAWEWGKARQETFQEREANWSAGSRWETLPYISLCFGTTGRPTSQASSSAPHFRESLRGQSSSVKWYRHHLKSPASCPSPAACLLQRQLGDLHHCLRAAWGTTDDTTSVRQLLGPVFASSPREPGSPGDISFLKKRRDTLTAVLYEKRWDLCNESLSDHQLLYRFPSLKLKPTFYCN